MHAPFGGDLLSILQDLISTLCVPILTVLASAIPEISRGLPKFKMGHVT